MTIRLYLDEDTMDKALASALRARGLDILTAHEADMIERHDDDPLAFAARKGRVLYGFNVADHCRLQAQGQSQAGIILAQQQRYSVGEQMRRLPGSWQRELLKTCEITSSSSVLGADR